MNELPSNFVNFIVLDIIKLLPLAYITVFFEPLSVKDKLYFCQVLNTLLEIPPNQTDRTLNKIYQQVKNLIGFGTDPFFNYLTA